MTTIITGENRMRLFMHSAIATSLALEINTGLKARPVNVSGMPVTPMNAAKAVCGSSKRTKKAVLRDYVAWLESTAPDRFDCEWSPNPSVRKAMEK